MEFKVFLYIETIALKTDAMDAVHCSKSTYTSFTEAQWNTTHTSWLRNSSASLLCTDCFSIQNPYLIRCTMRNSLTRSGVFWKTVIWSSSVFQNIFYGLSCLRSHNSENPFQNCCKSGKFKRGIFNHLIHPCSSSEWALYWSMNH